MPNKTTTRCFAVLACLGMLALSAPGLTSAAKSAKKVSVIQILKQPALIISALVPTFGSSVAAGGQNAGRFSGTVRPTGDIPTPMPGKGD
jgi:hypothetical protein